MLLTLARCKSFLGISGTSYDSLINMLLPIVQNDVLVETSQTFRSGLYNQVTTAVFDATAGTLTDPDSGFVTAGFENDSDIQVDGSSYNDGFFGVETVAAGPLTLYSGWSFVDETVNGTITVYLLKFPISLERTAAKMVDYHLRGPGGALDKLQLGNVKSERLGDHAITYQDLVNASGGISAYPPTIQGELNNYRRPEFP